MLFVVIVVLCCVCCCLLLFVVFVMFVVVVVCCVCCYGCANLCWPGADPPAGEGAVRGARAHVHQTGAANPSKTNTRQTI